MLTEEDRWFKFTDRALNTINREHIWQAITEAFTYLKYRVDLQAVKECTLTIC